MRIKLLKSVVLGMHGLNNFPLGLPIHVISRAQSVYFVSFSRSSFTVDTRAHNPAFITSALTRYNDFPQGVRDHLGSMWHRDAQQEAMSFLTVMRNPERHILSQIDKSVHNKIVENRKKLLPILSTRIFCGTHDIALRGKHSDNGNF